ncbi:hypothetical protein [uncultured Aquimarina sp.]|uniref:hypothetical protein n=1 Tax=uncultured Aquimarina sp. TaxID=575652 RepID=UPI0026021FBD|nr:hypothetical protein [uncultured Aquimarina sp.]
MSYSKLLDRVKIVSLYGLGQSIPMITQVIISLLIIKKHSTILWGEYVTLLLWVNFIILFSYFGNKNYLLKQFSEQPGKIHTTWLSNFSTRFFIFLFIGIVSFFIPLFEPYYILILVWLFLLFFNQSFEVLILYQKDFKFNFSVELIRNVFITITLLLLSGSLELEQFLKIIIGGLLIKAICYTFFYRRTLMNTKIVLDKQSLILSVPFLIPMVLGTLRTKIDSYYGTIYFSKEDLSHYQIFISFITLIQLGVAYTINPFIKIFYRISKKTRIVIEKQFLYLGIGIGAIAITIIYGIITYIYEFPFSNMSYLLGYLFMITLFVHLLLINEFYKYNKQTLVAIIIGVIAIIQVVLGYFTINTYQSIGALSIKVIGQWMVVLALIIFRKQFLSTNNK